MPTPHHLLHATAALALLVAPGACAPATHGDATAVSAAAAAAPLDEPARTGGWRLEEEDSPYLRQHADNPIDWFPWGSEAFDRARQLDRPVFLSIGYSSCHWCHVMERESFVDPDVAAYLNEHYVCIKVDREQRPDVDARYMAAVQAMGQAGGWPLSVWLTPDGKAYWGATYLPPVGRPGLPSFLDVARGMADAWAAERETIQSAVDHNTALLLTDRIPAPTGFDAGAILDAAGAELLGVLDPVRGGRLSERPMRFPPSMLLRAVWARALRDETLAIAPALTTLDAMAAGGLADHVAGGFHRYSTDPDWLVPHFEKMLYDNALLATAYAEAFALTGEQRFARTARRTLGWLADDMRSPEGLLFAARDADSLPWQHGPSDADPLDHAALEEGDVYAWTPDSLVAALGPEDGERAAQLFGVTPAGTFERGLSVLALSDTLDALSDSPPDGVPTGNDFLPWYDDVLARLAAVRAGRAQAFRDEKCLAEWNGLALTGFARAARLLDDEPLRAATADLARAIGAHLLHDDDGQLGVHHQVFAGRASGAGTLDDHAALARGLLDAYEATGEARLLAQAWRLAATLRARFEDTDKGGFFTTVGDDPLLPGRTRQIHDTARPAGQSLALQVLARLAPLDDSGALTTSLDRALTRLGPLVAEAPASFPSLVLALDAWHGPLAEVVLEGSGDEDHAALLAAARRRSLPAELLVADASDAAAALAAAGLTTRPSLLEGRGAPAAGGIAWVCRHGVCQLPATTPTELAARWPFVLHQDG